MSQMTVDLRGVKEPDFYGREYHPNHKCGVFVSLRVENSLLFSIEADTPADLIRIGELIAIEGKKLATDRQADAIKEQFKAEDAASPEIPSTPEMMSLQHN